MPCSAIFDLSPLSSIANILKVSDKEDIIGVHDADYVMQQISNSLKDSIKPDILIFTKVELLEFSGRTIIRIAVEEGTKNHIICWIKGLSHQVFMFEAVQYHHQLQKMQFEKLY